VEALPFHHPDLDPSRARPRSRLQLPSQCLAGRVEECQLSIDFRRAPLREIMPEDRPRVRNQSARGHAASVCRRIYKTAGACVYICARAHIHIYTLGLGRSVREEVRASDNRNESTATILCQPRDDTNTLSSTPGKSRATRRFVTSCRINRYFRREASID